jgi:glucan phosphoethanolaminetransferase (alkaline phosphatase superfamily)
MLNGFYLESIGFYVMMDNVSNMIENINVVLVWLMFVIGLAILLFPVVVDMGSYNKNASMVMIGAIILSVVPFAMVFTMMPSNTNSEIFDACKNKASLSDYSTDQLETACEYYESIGIYLDCVYDEIEYRNSMRPLHKSYYNESLNPCNKRGLKT